MLARQDELGVGLGERRGADVRLGGAAEARMKLPHQSQRIAFAGAMHAQHAGGPVAVVAKLGLERPARLGIAVELLDVPFEPWPTRKAVFARDHPLGVAQLRIAADNIVRTIGVTRVAVAETRERFAIAGAHGFQKILGALALLRQVRRGRQIDSIGIGHDVLLSSPPVVRMPRPKEGLCEGKSFGSHKWAQPFPRTGCVLHAKKNLGPARHDGKARHVVACDRRYAFAFRLTPGGGTMWSGTKKSGASGWLGSTRYWSKSVTPSLAKNVSSIRKWPVKLLAGLAKIFAAASARISGVRDMRMMASPPSRFFIAAVAMVVRGHSALTPILPRVSPASPSTTRLMPNLAMA